MHLPSLPSLPTLLIPPISSLHAFLPTQHPMNLIDITLGLLLTFITPLALITPATPYWRLIRAGIIAPIFCWSWIWLAYVPIKGSPQDTWGSAVLFSNFLLRTLELFVFYPPEENVYRIRHAPKIINYPQHHPESEGKPRHSQPNGDISVEEIIEPVPLPWTWSKFCWSTSLWWSWRGIGWNYAPKLPTRSCQPPFTPTSSRISFLISRGIYYALSFALLDLTKSYMDLSRPARNFFLGIPGAQAYEQLTLSQRAIYSVCVAVRVWFSIERTHVPVGMGMVTIGGIMGWEGELWSPWGWPPVFGGLRDLWRHPGVGYMWSKTWNQYNRRVLHTLGWIGLGESILGLPQSGSTTRPNPPLNLSSTKAQFINTPTSSINGRSSPTDPLPSAPPIISISSANLTIKASLSPSLSNSPSFCGDRVLSQPQVQLQSQIQEPSPKPSKHVLYAANLVKSAIVFLLSGLMHDAGSLVIVLTAIGNGQHKTWANVFVLTPFFAIQPIALVAEAIIRSTWRMIRPSISGVKKRQKVINGAQNGKTNGVPKSDEESVSKVEEAWLIFFERAVAFAWTWIWLGSTAKFFVEGLCQMGVYAPWPYVKPGPSLFGGLIWGVWWH